MTKLDRLEWSLNWLAAGNPERPGQRQDLLDALPELIVAARELIKLANEAGAFGARAALAPLLVEHDPRD